MKKYYGMILNKMLIFYVLIILIIQSISYLHDNTNVPALKKKLMGPHRVSVSNIYLVNMDQRRE